MTSHSTLPHRPTPPQAKTILLRLISMWPSLRVLCLLRISRKARHSIQASSVRAVLLDPSIEGGEHPVVGPGSFGRTALLPARPFLQARWGCQYFGVFLAGSREAHIPSLFSASSPSGRVLSLLPGGNASAELHMRAPISATAASAIPVVLTLSDADGISLQGHASVAWRRVSGVATDCPLDWQAAVVLTSTGAVTTTLQTPSEPGLWYLLFSNW